MSAQDTQSGSSLRFGLLVSRDLFFTSKVTGTAQALGRRVLVASDAEKAISLIETERPAVVFVDLAAGELASTSSIENLRAAAGEGTTFVAFGSHVDTAALAAAKAAGCHLVLPRSKFSAELTELIGKLL